MLRPLENRLHAVIQDHCDFFSVRGHLARIHAVFLPAGDDIPEGVECGIFIPGIAGLPAEGDTPQAVFQIQGALEGGADRQEDQPAAGAEETSTTDKTASGEVEKA